MVEFLAVLVIFAEEGALLVFVQSHDAAGRGVQVRPQRFNSH